LAGLAGTITVDAGEKRNDCIAVGVMPPNEKKISYAL
jgi:hypothetical protein